MLNSKPIGADKLATERWEATNRMAVRIFNAFWQNVSPKLAFPGSQAGDDASYAEWAEGSWKHYGMRKAGGAKHGIVRSIYYDGNIYE